MMVSLEPFKDHYNPVACAAISEAMNIIATLELYTGNDAWSKNSQHIRELDKLAQQLDFKNARALAQEAEWYWEDLSDAYRDVLDEGY